MRPPCSWLKLMRSGILKLEWSELRPQNATAHELYPTARGDIQVSSDKAYLVAPTKSSSFFCRSLLDKGVGGQVQYKSMLSQLVQLIFDPDRPELIDVEFRSHGLKDFIKTGFG